MGEKPLIPGVEKRLAHVLGCSPQLMNSSGGLRTLDMIMRTGLPDCIPQVCVDASFRSIQRQTGCWYQSGTTLDSSNNRRSSAQIIIGRSPATH